MDEMSVKDRQLLHEAIMYASEKHRGQKRKGTGLPYIIHPLEVLSIVMNDQPSVELAMAAVLHDVIEDTDGTYEEISEKFGKKTADLVMSHTVEEYENGKYLSWREIRKRSMKLLEEGSYETKVLVMADSLSNLRSMYYDFQRKGETMWDKFFTDKEDIAWYYRGKMEILSGFEDHPIMKKDYLEYQTLFEYLFEESKAD